MQKLIHSGMREICYNIYLHVKVFTCVARFSRFLLRLISIDFFLIFEFIKYNRPDGVVGYHVSLTPIRSWDRTPVWSFFTPENGSRIRSIRGGFDDFWRAWTSDRVQVMPTSRDIGD